MSSSSPLVLITGITGFLSGHVLDFVLASPANYRVRGTLRSLSKKQELLSRLKPEDRERVQLVEVQDIATSDLLDAVRGVKYILHVASPFRLNCQDVEKDLLIPAIEGTLNLCRFAKKEPSVEKIVITSSFAAVFDLKAGGTDRPGFVYTAQHWNPSTYQDAIDFGGDSAFSYTVSKKLAEKLAYEYVESEKPHYQIASINPPMIYGPTLQPGARLSNLNTSNAAIYNLINHADEFPEDRIPLFCDARDVADAHVLALEAPNAMGNRFLLCGGALTWGHAVSFIAENYPDLQDRLPNGWKQAIQTPKDLNSFASLDTTPAEQILGITFRDWKTTLKDTIDSLLQLEKKPDWKA